LTVKIRGEEVDPAEWFSAVSLSSRLTRRLAGSMRRQDATFGLELIEALVPSLHEIRVSQEGAVAISIPGAERLEFCKDASIQPA
jgi:hypothetical protein